MESVPKYCSLWGQALAPGTLLPSTGPQGSACLPACPDHSLLVSSAGCQPPGAWKLLSLKQQDTVFCPMILQPSGGRKGPLSSPSFFKDCSVMLPVPELDGTGSG